MKQLLLSLLEAGSTGCVHGRGLGGQALEVYVMRGEILAAHGADDRQRLLQMLQNGGLVEASRVDSLRRAHQEGSTITEELFEFVPEEVLQELLTERFRENVFQFLQVQGPTRFEELESIFVENIQVGHDSRSLMDELEAVASLTARLRQPPGLVLAPGAGTMKEPAHTRLAALCRPRLPIGDLVARSPWESSRTLAQVAEMLERGVLVAVAPREETTDRPALRPPSAAKVVVAPGRPEMARSTDRRMEPAGRDAVAAALASAVSAAVAKVGRQKEPAEGANPPPVAGPPPVRRDAAPSPQGRSPLDAVSAPMGRRPAPAAATIVRNPEPVRPSAPPAPASVARTDAPSPPPEPARKPANKLPEFDVDQPTEEIDEELAAFQDYDYERQGGEFTTDQDLLDRVEIVTLAPEPAPKVERIEEPDPSGNILLEMEDAEHATKAELASAVALNFAGPKLGEDDARRKLEVVNEVFGELARALDIVGGSGAGQSRVQLIVEGTPGAFSALFKGVEVDAAGQMPLEAVLKNLRKRPASEHRRLLNRSTVDLIERALSLANEELEESKLEGLLERVAGYQQRLGM